jgi:protein MpaA
LFQEDLIRKFKPQKILSVHSPLNFLDYDGPSILTLSKFPLDYTRECDRLRRQLKANSGGFFPGSLGNYAGYELGIPTLTLELPSTDPNKAEAYWKRFSQGIRTMIHFSMPNYAAGALEAQIGG